MNNDEHYTKDDGIKGNTNRNRIRFPVRTQLLLLSFIICLLFVNTIVDKTVSFFDGGDNSNEPTEEIYMVSKEIKEEPQQIDSVEVRAKSAYVWDIKEQRLLYEKNANEKLPLASITKLMTALVAYELVSNDTEVVVNEVASSQESGGYIKEGEVFKTKDLADFALISSYNSAAYALANSVGEQLGDRDPVAQFVAGMNIKASELELESLEFHNPTGLDMNEEMAGAYGSAKDVSRLVEYIFFNYPEILSPTIIGSTRIYNESGQYHDASNTNDILNQLPNILGSKTGYTDLAGGNLTVVINIGLDHPILITVLGSTINGRFSDVKLLAEAVSSR